MKTVQAPAPEEVSRRDEADCQDRASVHSAKASLVHGVDL